jgi:hypothetical protein
MPDFAALKGDVRASMFHFETFSGCLMRWRLSAMAVLFSLGLAVPAAGEARWIDPWGPEVEYGALAGGPEAVDPFADERATTRPEITGSLGDSAFQGGVGQQQSFIAIHNGFYFKPHLPAGQRVMTGAQLAPVHPRAFLPGRSGF